MEYLEDLLMLLPNLFIILMFILGFVYVYINYVNSSKYLEKSRLALSVCEDMVYSHPDGIPYSMFSNCSSPDKNVQLELKDQEGSGDCISNKIDNPEVVISLPVLIRVSDRNTHVGMVVCKV